MRMYELDWLIGIGIIALLMGFLIGLVMGRTVLRGRKTLDTEAQLQASEEALTSYRAEVYDQFEQTARKFDTLNESYNDLHRHLANSANVLLGDGINTPLLRGPAEPEAQSSERPAEEAQADAEEQHTDGPEAADVATEESVKPIEPEQDAPSNAVAPVSEADAAATTTNDPGTNPQDGNTDAPKTGS